MIRVITYKKRSRTQAYTSRRPRRAVARSAPAAPRVNNGVMLFDHPASLPIATMRSSSRVDRLISELRAARRWVRPRLVPAAVAIVGMLAVLGSAEYLTHLARYTPEPPTAIDQAQAQVHAQVAQLRADSEPPRAVVLLEQGPPGAVIVLDEHAGLAPLGPMIQLPSHPVPLKLVPQQ